jgi:predicted O-methyltransferase YrrM
MSPTSRTKSNPDHARPADTRSFAEQWSGISKYLADVFAKPDPQLATLMSRAIAEGIPDIAVSPETGRFLSLLARMAGGLGGGGGARMIVEVGTLAGYSTIWLSRGLAPGGRIVTLELNPKHADFAQREFARAGIAARVQIRRGPALESLTTMARTMPPASVDMVFLDCVKTEYPEYFRIVRPMIRAGGLLVADNILSSNTWRIDDGPGSSPDRDAVDEFNHLVAADPAFESIGVPIGNGVLVARRLGA